MTTIRRFVALSPLEQSLLWQAMILLPVVRASLFVLGCRRTQAWLKRLTARPRSQQSQLDKAAHAPTTQRMVDAAARSGIVTASCLPRALVTCALLERNGVNAALKIGVRRHLGRIEAHAWVETDHDNSRDPVRREGFMPLAAPLTQHALEPIHAQR